MTAPRTYRVPVLAATAIDGDTVRCVVDLGWRVRMEVLVRLAGIDAPERTGPTRMAGEGVQHVVQRLLAAAMANGKLELDSYELDKLGRTLGDFVDASGKGGEPNGLVDMLLDLTIVKRTGAGGKRPDWTEAETQDVIARCAEAVQ